MWKKVVLGKEFFSHHYLLLTSFFVTISGGSMTDIIMFDRDCLQWILSDQTFDKFTQRLLLHLLTLPPLKKQATLSNYYKHQTFE
jgi:hypothetical protein